MDKNLQTLELDKVLALLAEQTTCDDAKEAALALRPAADPGEIALLLDQTEDAFSMLARFGAPSFGGLHNVNGPLQRAAAGGCLNMTELLQVGDTLRALRILDDWHGHLAGTSSSLNFFFDGITVNKYLENRIFTCIVSPEEMADKASEELYDIRRKIKAKAAAIRQRLDGMIHSTHYQKFLQEPIVTQRGGRFVVPVKAEHRGEVPGLVHDTSSSGATVFIEPAAVVDANNDIKVLEGREREEVQRITELRCCQSGPLQIVAISLINNNAIGHFHDAAFDALQLIARTRQLYQQEEVYHRMYGSLTLPHPYRLYKYLVETGSLTKHNRFTRLACHATQRTGRGTGTYKGLGMNGELLHTRLITENTAFAAFTARVNGKNGQLAAVFLQYMQAKYINRGTFTGTGHTTDTHTDGVARIGQTLLYHLLRHSLMFGTHTFH